jgi:hypothetical protein
VLRPHVLIELTVKNIQLPPRYLPVSSFVNDVAKHSPEIAHIGCIDPAESAADKLSAIAWRIPDRVRGGEDDDPYLFAIFTILPFLKTQRFSMGPFPDWWQPLCNTTAPVPGMIYQFQA